MSRPTGREAVMAALISATTELLISDGTRVSVREIASRAGVNHGLVHTYFGSKRALLAAALDGINQRASEESVDGFPPPDLATRRSGELGRAIAQLRLGEDSDLFSSHPISANWRDALSRARPDLPGETIDLMVAEASALALGWAVFGDHIGEILGFTGECRAELDQHISKLIAELGGIPLSPLSQSSPDPCDSQ